MKPDPENIHQLMHQTTQTENQERTTGQPAALAAPYGQSGNQLTATQARERLHEALKSKEWLRGYNDAVRAINTGRGTAEEVKALIGHAFTDLEPSDFTSGWTHACQWHIANLPEPEPPADNHLALVLHDKRVSYVSRTGTGAMPTINATHQECVVYFLETVPHTSYEVIDDRTQESPTPWYDRPIVGPITIRDIAELIGLWLLFVLAIIGLIFGLAL